MNPSVPRLQYGSGNWISERHRKCSTDTMNSIKSGCKYKYRPVLGCFNNIENLDSRGMDNQGCTANLCQYLNSLNSTQDCSINQ